MRDIKFRLWQPVTKRYFSWEQLKDDHFLQSLECHEGWEQFTGLLDKNGKPIYEGDIVDDGQSQGNHCLSGKHHVYFDRGGFSPFSEMGWEGTMDNEDCIVIGNIHENPEILESVK